jgi:hypothetical protein
MWRALGFLIQMRMLSLVRNCGAEATRDFGSAIGQFFPLSPENQAASAI